MTHHTPGPWTFIEQDRWSEAKGPLTICGPKHDDLVNVYSSDDATVSISRPEAAANALLIAAAPDLLAVCLRLYRSHGRYSYMAEMLRPALAAALGIGEEEDIPR